MSPVAKHEGCIPKQAGSTEIILELCSRSCGSSLTSSSCLLPDPNVSSDCRGTGDDDDDNDDAIEEVEPPDREEWPLEKTDTAGEDVTSDVLAERRCM